MKVAEQSKWLLDIENSRIWGKPIKKKTSKEKVKVKPQINYAQECNCNIQGVAKLNTSRNTYNLPKSIRKRGSALKSGGGC